MPKALLPKLFGAKPTYEDHRWYKRLWAGRTPQARHVRRFCALTYDEFEQHLDVGFPTSFRRQTPARFSELFYAAGFRQAGWKPIAPVRRFDLAFAMEGGRRLLVEVVTPQPPPPATWTEEEVNGFTIRSADGSSKEAALLRLTAGFAEKARIIRQAIAEGHATSNDFKIIAISGLRISQETPIAVHASGMPPDFARAFLPIGHLFVPISLDQRSAEIQWGEFQHRFSDEISKPEGKAVQRDAFVSGDFPHVDAIAYSEVHTDDLQNIRHQIGVLHNPTSQYPYERPALRMGTEYFGKLDGEQLHLERVRSPELAAVEDAHLASDGADFDELFGRSE